MKRAIAALLSICLLFGSSFTAVCENEAKNNTELKVQEAVDSDSYSLYAEKYENAPSDIKTTKKGTDFKSAKGDERLHTRLDLHAVFQNPQPRQTSLDEEFVRNRLFRRHDSF